MCSDPRTDYGKRKERVGTGPGLKFLAGNPARRLKLREHLGKFQGGAHRFIKGSIWERLGVLGEGGGAHPEDFFFK